MSSFLLRERLDGSAPLFLARIIEDHCIGCALCIKACPFDAIIGAQGWLHEVLEEACVGCELCVPKCPVDCIVMEPHQTTLGAAELAAAKKRLRDRKKRLASRAAQEKAAFKTARDEIRRRLEKQHRSS